jgi:hypothetical protein
LDDLAPLVDDPLNHRGYKTNDLRDLRDLLTDDHDLLEDDPLNHRGYKTNDLRDLRDLPTDDRDLLVDDRDLGHHFARMQDDLLDDYLDGMGVRHDPLMDDHGLLLDGLNDRLRHQHRRDVRDAKVCRILLPVADDVDRDFLGLAPDEVYLQTTRKQRTYARCE